VSFAVVLAALLGLALVSASAAGVVVVQVQARDSSFTLSRRSAPIGSTVRFVVRNRGKARHDFVINGKRTRSLRPGQVQTLTVRFTRAGKFRYFSSVGQQARNGLQGTFTVTAAPAPPPPPPAPPPVITGSVALTSIGTFQRPVLVTAPPGDRERLFVVEQTGTIRIVRNGELLPRPFLDLRDRVHVSSEPGLLSLAFAPDYETSGLFYVAYNMQQGNGDLRIAEYRRDPTDPDVADPYSARAVLTITKPWENHNGGMLQFGPDGYLYMSVGDGDSGVLYPPGFFAQTRDDLLGDILRIDPRHGDPYAVPSDNPFVGVDGVRPEIWAYGLRNPWRFWIDRQTGSVFIGDAGEGAMEEVDFLERGQSGANFGWPCFEGTLPFDATASCANPVAPLVGISHETGACAVIGGVVARDPRLPVLAGRYLFGDFCTGKITVLQLEGGKVVATDDLGVEADRLASFGVDGLDRIYVMTIDGNVLRLDPR
jgi:glucose/arabinose dehydrogenase